jgi:hypothetical protein
VILLQDCFAVMQDRLMSKKQSLHRFSDSRCAELHKLAKKYYGEHYVHARGGDQFIVANLVNSKSFKKFRLRDLIIFRAEILLQDCAACLIFCHEFMVFWNFISGMKKSFKRSDEESLRGLGFMEVDSSKQAHCIFAISDRRIVFFRMGRNGKFEYGVIPIHLSRFSMVLFVSQEEIFARSCEWGDDCIIRIPFKYTYTC